MSDMLQLVVWIGNCQGATLRVVSLLECLVNIYDKLKHIGQLCAKDIVTLFCSVASRPLPGFVNSRGKRLGDFGVCRYSF